MLRSIRALLAHPTVKRLLANKEAFTAAVLYGGTAFHFLYGVFRLVSGAFSYDAYVDTASFFYLQLALNRLVLIRALHTKAEGAVRGDSVRMALRTSGVLLLLTGVTVFPLVAATVRGERLSSYPRYVVFASAAYAVYSLISALTDIRLLHRAGRPLLSASRAVVLTASAVSAFTFLIDLLFTIKDTVPSLRRLFILVGGLLTLSVAVGLGLRLLLLSRSVEEKLPPS